MSHKPKLTAIVTRIRIGEGFHAKGVRRLTGRHRAAEIGRCPHPGNDGLLQLVASECQRAGSGPDRHLHPPDSRGRCGRQFPRALDLGIWEHPTRRYRPASRPSLPLLTKARAIVNLHTTNGAGQQKGSAQVKAPLLNSRHWLVVLHYIRDESNLFWTDTPLQASSSFKRTSGGIPMNMLRQNFRLSR